MPSLRVNDLVRRAEFRPNLMDLDRDTIVKMMVHLMDMWGSLYPGEELGRAIGEHLRDRADQDL